MVFAEFAMDVEPGSTSFKPKLTKISPAVMDGEKLDWLEYELVEGLLSCP